MYWQKRFNRSNPDQDIENEMLEIRKEHKDYGCLRMKKELENKGLSINKKSSTFDKKLGSQVKSFTRKSRPYSSYRGMDLYNSETLSYRISEKPNAAAIMNGLAEAIKKTNDSPFRKTFHSDQGWAYQIGAYSDKLKENKIFQTMSRKGNYLILLWKNSLVF